MLHDDPGTALPAALRALNQAQRQAVLHQGGPLLILAGAGSGKTRVITHRLAELCKRGVDPHRVLAVTFTNKAAGEMRERASRLIHGAAAQMWIGTFHSICARLLRIHAGHAGLQRDFVIFDDQDALTLVSQVLKALALGDQVLSPRAVLSALDQAKNQGTSAEEYKGRDYFTDIVAQVYPVYQRRLREQGAVDFGDLLLLPLQLCEKDPEVARALGGRFEHVLVDEFQDTNLVQYRLVNHLARRTRQIFAVGDDDQAIYGWRGADVRNLLEFERDWPDAQVVKLEQNYRSTQVILEAANAVIARNRHRRGKHLFTETPGGEPITCYEAADERREAWFVVKQVERLRSAGRALGDFAVFYRTNAQSRVLEEALRNAGLPYTVIGGMRFYDRAEVKDVLAYLRLCHNQADEVALRRVINVPPRGIGEATLDKLAERARTGDTTLWQALGDLLASGGARDNPLGTGPRRKLQAFVDLVRELQELGRSQGLAALAEAVVERTGYLERLAADRGPEATARRENVMELIGSIQESAREAEARGQALELVDYLERIALASSVDSQARGVALMTVHAAKGLEFPVVFVTGLEDGLFPSLRQRDEYRDGADPIDEERRLAYVAITRARERLFLTCAQQRRLYGQSPKVNQPSRFLAEIPAACLAPARSQESPGRGEPREAPRQTSPDDGGYRIERDPDADGVWGWGPGGSGLRGRRGASAERGAAVSRAQEDGLRVEYDDAGDAHGAFRLGQRVHHQSYGEGEVQAFSGAGTGLKLVVYFPQAGARTILARFVTPV